jgi:hypothetical protein
MADPWAAARAWLQGHRGLAGKFAFELVIVFVGVTGAFALENLRQQGEESAYRQRMIAALAPSLDDVVRHSGDIDRELTAKLDAFDGAVARGGRPPLPVYREGGAERPPTRAWDGIVATGAARALQPEVFFRLVNFYNYLDSLGERYIRYNDFTETRVLTLGAGQAEAYDPASGRLKPEFAAYVERLRGLREANRELVRRAASIRADLARGDGGRSASAPADARRTP